METQGPESHCRDERSTTPLGRTKFSESPSREETEKVSVFPFAVVAAAAIIIVKYQLKNRKSFLRLVRLLAFTYLSHLNSGFPQ
jgi:hypothetical protein